MAKKYGGRWEIIDGPALGIGGQGTVFRVKDSTGELDGEFALKRIPDINRRDRFRREVEAIKRLTDPATRQAHPNVITLIDHSALDDANDADKQFLVMPIAHGSDLSAPGRFALYKDSIDAVLQVAKQLASALIAAHAAQIIHRDVKPKNVLFTGNGHETWLSDFGICLIRESPRLTETPEVMGGRAFMAPELEDGGRLEVTPAADIYSLGKVIYYMLSGGVIVPRERVHEAQFSGLFDKGQRYRLIEILLHRMICPRDRRIQSATEVLKELSQIEDWERNALLLPMSGSALAAVEELKRRSLETGRIAAENREARAQEAQALGTLQQSVTGWLTAELEKIAATVASDTITCEVREAGLPNGNFRVQTGQKSMYRALNGIELTFADHHDPANRKHALQFFLCEHIRQVVMIQSVPVQKPPSLVLPRDGEFGIVPIYRQSLKHQNPAMAASLGYINRKDHVGMMRGRVEAPGARNWAPVVQRYRVERIAPSFLKDASVHAAFLGSEWPANEALIRDMLQEALDAFFEKINS